MRPACQPPAALTKDLMMTAKKEAAEAVRAAKARLGLT
jgi:hypothetical protein